MAEYLDKAGLKVALSKLKDYVDSKAASSSSYTYTINVTTSDGTSTSGWKVLVGGNIYYTKQTYNCDSNGQIQITIAADGNAPAYIKGYDVNGYTTPTAITATEWDKKDITFNLVYEKLPIGVYLAIGDQEGNITNFIEPDSVTGEEESAMGVYIGTSDCQFVMCGYSPAVRYVYGSKYKKNDYSNHDSDFDGWGNTLKIVAAENDTSTTAGSQIGSSDIAAAVAIYNGNVAWTWLSNNPNGYFEPQAYLPSYGEAAAIMYNRETISNIISSFEYIGQDDLQLADYLLNSKYTFWTSTAYSDSYAWCWATNVFNYTVRTLTQFVIPVSQPWRRYAGEE